MPNLNLNKVEYRMDISIVIINYNTRKLVKDCIESLLKAVCDLACEIIVVDNASTDGSVEMLSQDFPNMNVIRNEFNFGFSKANNQGIRVAKGEYILLLNSDTLVERDCLLDVYRFARSKSDIGVVGCKVLNADLSLQSTCYRKPTFISELIFFTKNIVSNFWDPVTFLRLMKDWDHNDARVVHSLSGCFLFINRKVLEKVGLLDEDFFMYYEDMEFCRRVNERSPYKVYYYPHARIIHLHGRSSVSMKSAIMIKCFRSCKSYFLKFSGKTYAWFFVICCKTIWILEVGFFLMFSFIPKCKEKFNLILGLLKG